MWREGCGVEVGEGCGVEVREGCGGRGVALR